VTAPARTTTDRPSSPLDRRRDQASTTAHAAEKAQAGVTELNNRLQTNTNLTTQQSQALRNAEAEANRLKRSLKAGVKERDRLTKAHKRAVAQADKAKAKAKAADEKYSKAVLADLVRREKQKDAARTTTPATRQPAVSAVPNPEPERPNVSAAAATRTAARKTAARTRTTTA
jgi:chromosome segregation ATPase